MTRRGTAKKCTDKDKSSAAPMIVTKVTKNIIDKDEKAPVEPRIMRIPNSEIRRKGKNKASAKTRAVSRKLNPVSTADNTTATTSTAITPTATAISSTSGEVKPFVISSDISDYYSLDDDDTSDTSDDDYRPFSRIPHIFNLDSSDGIFSNSGSSGRFSDSEYADYLEEMFWNSESDFDSDDSDEWLNSDFDGSEAERIFENIMWIHDFSSSIAFYSNRVASYLERFQRTATPIVRARIEAFINSTVSFLNIIDAINNFKVELSELTGDPLTDFPVYDPEGTAPRGSLSSTEIARLPRHSYRGQTQQEKRLKEPPHKCCICMAEFEIDDNLILLEKCSHRFHSECLEPWLRRSDQCPICRKVVK